MGPQGADGGPEAVGSLGHRKKGLIFHLDHELACGLQENPVQQSAHVSRPRHVHWGFIVSLPVGNDFVNGSDSDYGRLYA